MDQARTKATELAVELLRPSMSNFNLVGVISIDGDDDFIDQSKAVAKRIGQMVRAVSLEIETYIR